MNSHAKVAPSSQNDIAVSIEELLNHETVDRTASLSSLCENIASCSASTLTDKTYQSLSTCLYNVGAAPSLQRSEDSGYGEADFPDCAKIALLCMRVYEWLLSVLQQAGHSITVHVVEQICTESLLICAEHMETASWSNLSAVEASSRLLAQITSVPSVHSTEHLCTEQLPAILAKLKSRLRSWKLNPAASAAFCWVITQVSELDDELLASVLPSSLRFVDDFEPRHQIAGIRCLHHVVMATAPAVLHRHSANDVIYTALQRLLLTRHAEVVTAVVGCLAECLPRLDSSTAAKRVTDILMSICSSMGAENLLALRLAYAQCLPPVITLAGINSVPILPALLRVFVDYLEVVGLPDEHTRLAILHALRALITQTWPRFTKRRCACVLTAVMRCVYDVIAASDLPEDMRDKVLAAAADCLKTLTFVNEPCVKELLSKLDQVSANDHWRDILYNL